MDFTKASYRLYCQKKVAILKEKSEKIIKIYVLDTQIIKKKLYAIFLCTLITFSFREYFLNKPENLFLNFDILLGTSQRTIYMIFKKIHFAQCPSLP